MHYHNTDNVAEAVKVLLNNKNAGFDELFLDIGSPEKKVKHFKQIIPVTIHHFYITDEIKEPNFYLNMINTIRTAEQHDTIIIYLNTPGGDLYTAIQIMAAMHQSQAMVITSLEGQVCSAGTMVFLAGKKSIVHPNSTFMIHNYSQMVGGKGNEVTSQVRYTEEFFKELADKIYGGFLTPEEIALITQGKDFWMGSKEVCNRLGDKLITQDVPEQDADELLKQIIGNVKVEKEVQPSTVVTEKPKKSTRKKVAAKPKV